MHSMTFCTSKAVYRAADSSMTGVNTGLLVSGMLYRLVHCGDTGRIGGHQTMAVSPY